MLGAFWRSRTVRVAAAVAALCVPLATGCATASGESTPSATTAAAGAGGTTGYLEEDVQFSLQMIPHHRQTIELAELSDGRTSDAYVRRLSAKMIEDEQADITLMSSWLRSWNVNPPPEDTAGHDMPGMLGPTQIAELKRRSGGEFDRMWLTLLAKHLDSGVQMAETVQGKGIHGPTAELAGKIIANQRKLIDEIVKQVA
ncbi:MAG: Conserved putative secreted protein [Nonomuraea muscovyensis]|nr:Conserved putative secreted protein [Nonomuraea muscovyensis]